MFVMLLGSIATMQAQSFSFSCGYANSMTAPGFIPAQTIALETASFTLTSFEGGTQYERFITIHRYDASGALYNNDGSPVTFQRRIHVTHYMPPKEFLNEETGIISYNHYQLFVGGGTRNRFFNTLQEAIDAALAIN